MAATDPPPSYEMAVRLDSLENQLTTVHQLILDRLDGGGYGEPEAKRSRRLPSNVKPIELDTIHSMYHECFMPPVYTEEFPEDGRLLGDLQGILHEYRKKVSYAVIEQNGPMDHFVESVAGILGPQAAKITLRRPLAFSHDGEYYQMLGYGVADACMLSQIDGFFQYPPIANFNKSHKFPHHLKTNEQRFAHVVLQIPSVMCHWAEVVAYGLLKDMDAKVHGFADRKRMPLNMELFGAAKKMAAASYVDHWVRKK